MSAKVYCNKIQFEITA